MECVSYNIITQTTSIKRKRIRCLDNINNFLKKYFNEFNNDLIDESKINIFIEKYVNEISECVLNSIIKQYASYEIHEQSVSYFMNILDKFEHIDQSMTYIEDNIIKKIVVMVILKNIVMSIDICL